MKSSRLTIGIITTVAAGMIAYIIIRKNILQKRLLRVSEEGYETAYDVLYPMKRRSKYYR
jgi:hypothetical protein